MNEYILKPIMTPQTVSLTPSFDKPATIKFVPPRQPLPAAVIDPAKPMLELGLDVHLEFTMAVAQKDHGKPHARASSPANKSSPKSESGSSKGSKSSACRKAAPSALSSSANSRPPAPKMFSSRPSP